MVGGISVPAVIDRVALVRYDRASALSRRDPLAARVLEPINAAFPSSRRFDSAPFLVQVLGQEDVEHLPAADFVRAHNAYRLIAAGDVAQSLLSVSA